MAFGSAKYRTLISPPTRWDFGLLGNRGLATAGALTFFAGALVFPLGAYCKHEDFECKQNDCVVSTIAMEGTLLP